MSEWKPYNYYTDAVMHSFISTANKIDNELSTLELNQKRMLLDMLINYLDDKLHGKQK